MDIKIKKEQFIKLYETKTNTEIAEMYDVQVHQVLKIAKQLGLKKPRGRKTNKLFLE